MKRPMFGKRVDKLPEWYGRRSDVDPDAYKIAYRSAYGVWPPEEHHWSDGGGIPWLVETYVAFLPEWLQPLVSLALAVGALFGLLWLAVNVPKLLFG